MKFLRHTIMAMVAVFVAASTLQAATWQAQGVLGNSGIQGEGLIRLGKIDLTSRLIFQHNRCATGIAIGSDQSLYVSGGDRINNISLDGHLIESLTLEPAALVNSQNFAVLNNTLYFFAHQKIMDDQLYALPMTSGAVAKPVVLQLPKRKRPHYPYVIAATPLNGKLVLLAVPKESQGQGKTSVYFVDPKAGTLTEIFQLDAAYYGGVAVDTRTNRIYIGILVERPAGRQFQLGAYQPDGTPVDGFPVSCTNTGSMSTQFRGWVSLASNALWDTGVYGFLSRLNFDGSINPGIVLQWHDEVSKPTQIVGLGDSAMKQSEKNPLFIASTKPDAVYYATWDNEQNKLTLERRIGALPIINSLGLSKDGLVTTSTEWSQLWWPWNATADDVAQRSDMHVAITPSYFEGNRFFALAAFYRVSNIYQKQSSRGIRAAVFTARKTVSNEAKRDSHPVPMKKPIGLSVPPKGGANVVFVTDAETKQIWRANFLRGRPLLPVHDTWKPVSITGYTLQDPTDIVAQVDGQLLVADAGNILLLKPNGNTYHLVWKMNRWGDKPDEHFGEHLRFSGNQSYLLISDTDRQRLIYMDWTKKQVVAQFGVTDEAGNDLKHLEHPTLVSLQGNRAVIADAGNQRILKLQFQE